MKILHFIPYIPTPPTFGGALRIYHLLKHNYENHDLTIAGFSDSGSIKELQKAFPGVEDKIYLLDRPFKKRFKRLSQTYSLFTNNSNWYLRTSSQALQQVVDDLVEKNDYDLVQFEFPVMCQIQIKSGAKTIMDAHNVEYDNFQRMYKLAKSPFRKYFYKREYEKFFVEEIELASRQDAIFTTSYRDKNIFHNHLPEKPIHVIPNGVDTDFFTPSEQQAEPNSLVFTGMMGYVPNNDGICYFIDHVLPLVRQKIPDIKLYVVGKNPPASVRKRASDNIIVTGFVDDVRPYVHRSSVYVVPLRMGGGTRLKVLEALAMKKPVVTTSIGCEGIEVVNNEHLLIADKAKDFAESVIKLLKDKKEVKRLSDNGYELIDKKYKWSAIGQQMEGAFNEVLNIPKAPETISKSLQQI